MHNDNGEVSMERQFGRDEVLRDMRDDVKGMREAMGTFAQKTDVLAISIKMDDMVTRREFDRHVIANEKKFDSFEVIVSKLATRDDVARLERAVDSGPIPQWVYTAIVAVVAIGSYFYHFK